MLPVSTTSDSAKESKPSLRPTPEMEMLAQKVIDAFARYRPAWDEGMSPAYLANVFCGLEKRGIAQVINDAMHLHVYSTMDDKDIAQFVIWSGYKIEWNLDGSPKITQSLNTETS